MTVHAPTFVPKILPLAVVAALASTMLPARAESDASDPAIVLGGVTVSGRSSGVLKTRQVLTSVDILGADRIEDRNVAQSWELLGLLPGIQLTETRMGAESGKPTFRAFNGEGYINGIKVLIDGIPSNVNSGNQRFIDMVFPLDIDSIEVVRGTNDPRHGLHAIGGSIDVVTRQGGNYGEARLSAGSFSTREVQLAFGREADGFAQNYFVGHQHSDGYRAHSASERQAVGGKWFLSSPNGDLRLGLIARMSAQRAEEPGFMTAAQMAEDRWQSFAHNANDGDTRDMRQASVHLDWKIRPDLHLSGRLYNNIYQDDRRVTFTGNSGLGNSPRQRRVWDEEQNGLSGRLTWRAGAQLTLDGGVQLERQRNHYQRWRYAYALPTDFSQPTTTSNDDSYSLDNSAVFVQALVQATPTLRLVPGWRIDRFQGDTLINTSGLRGSLQDYGSIHQPKLSMIWSPSASTSVYANWGRTFQILTGSRAPAYLTSASQAPFGASINTGKELGVKLTPLDGLETRVALWRQDATDEVANMPSTGTTVGLGRTRRQGLDLQATLRASEQLRLWASHSLQEARVVQAYTASGVSLAGKEVFSTPRHISNLGIEYSPDAQWRLTLQGRAQGSYYIDDLNTQGKHGAHVLFDLSVRRALSSRASLDLQVRNLADRQHAYTWYDNFFWPSGSAQPMSSPGAPRSVTLALNLKM